MTDATLPPMTDAAPQAPQARLAPMTPDGLSAVLAIEQSSHVHPWTRGDFLDALRTGWYAQCLLAASDELLGYFVAMPGVDEVHLLVLTVAPAHRGQGCAHVMLDALALWARSQGASRVLLEVRVSNTRARSIYERNGFAQVGLRRDYYPTWHGRAREDALVMSRDL